METDLLIYRCAEIGFSHDVIKLLCSFFGPRCAKVVDGGSASKSFPINNIVYQGTVPGPYFWNVFFAPVAHVIDGQGLDHFAFGDDLNAMLIVPNNVDNEKFDDKFEAVSGCLAFMGHLPSNEM